MKVQLYSKQNVDYRERFSKGIYKNSTTLIICRAKVRKFSCLVLDFSIHNVSNLHFAPELISLRAKGLLKKSQGLSYFCSIFWRYAGLLAGKHYRGEDLAFFSSSNFFPTTFVYICSENALHIGGFYFMWLQFMRLAAYERRVPNSLCSPLIRWRM